MKTYFKDEKGKCKHRSTVEKLAVDNILHSMTNTEMAEEIARKLDDEELLQWATDFDGTFSS